MTQRYPGRGLTAEEQAIVDAFDRAPAASETFHHLITCVATDDAPGLCECPPAVVSIDDPNAYRRATLPTFLTGAELYARR